MLKEIRFENILNYLKNNDIAEIEKMSKDLKISLTTLRRDLSELEIENKIVKLHGGAKLVKEKLISEDFLENKLQTNVEEKKQLAQIANRKIKANTTLFLDAGSNPYFLAKIIDPSLNLTIVTNSIINVQELVKNGHQKIYLLGGKFTDVTGAILGYEAIEALKNYAFDLSFVGVNAVDDQGNVYTTSSDHAQIKIEIIKHSSKAFGLADSSKLHSKSFYKFTTIKDLEIIS
ncbi:DeoR family transcriptional regulator [Williamsoniiplasma somnilux]|uniref:DeoR family transcriptional regulator n=1 Tax=Williamsoniiplasma somnilux TaxID=215578 RepID=A0A2K8NXG9_9MOLU|nr:DeoR/GlpR family DNA-binding transcription regulator [Williamsoniiplasma somnilux]ATZ18535.1 DeoR family transcriptional regulator [Williamsoniiplasma somnilux]